MTTTPKRPSERLRAAVLDTYELAEHEAALLEQACHTADLCADLQARLDADGPLVDGAHGPKVHPAAVELRQQRIALARLLAALRVPDDDTDALTVTSSGGRRQRRVGVRGVYGMGGAA